MIPSSSGGRSMINSAMSATSRSVSASRSVSQSLSRMISSKSAWRSEPIIHVLLSANRICVHHIAERRAHEKAHGQAVGFEVRPHVRLMLCGCDALLGGIVLHPGQIRLCLAELAVELVGISLALHRANLPAVGAGHVEVAGIVLLL